MSTKEFYMFSHNSVSIKKSYENISLILTAELTPFSDFEIALSLLEDIRKSLIAHYQKDIELPFKISGEIRGLTVNIPQSLHSRLVNRAFLEKCSIDTLCADYLSLALSGTRK